MKDQKATFLYIRTTEQEQKTGGSEIQGRALAQWCTENQIKNFQIFADHGAPRLVDDRPALSRMREKMKTGECSTVIITSLSRIARTMEDLRITLDLVKNQHVRFLSLEDEIDTHSTLGVLKFLDALTRMQKEVIGERLRSGRCKTKAMAETEPAEVAPSDLSL